MLKEIKKEVTELCLGSSARGVPNLTRSKHSSNKILWICFLISSSIASIYYVYSGINEYLKYEVVSVVKSVYEQPSEFPTVTFCPTQGFENINRNKNRTKIDDFVKQVKFAYDSSIGTDLGNHFETLDTQQYGKCFRFNSGKNMTNQTIPIKNSTIGGREDYFMLSLKPNVELMVWIHNKSFPPKIEKYNNHDDPITIDNKKINYIAIDKTIESKQAEPYSQCVNDPKNFKQNKTIIEHIRRQGEVYSQKNCLELCFDLHYIQSNPCNCTSNKLGSIWLDCWINKENQLENSCTYNFKTNFYQKTLLDVCGDYCPLECDSVSYTYTLSSNDQNDSTVIMIYYRSLKYLSIKEYPKMQLFDLVSNLGGSLGLFIGLSLVSLFEVVEFLMVIAFILIKKSKTVKAMTQNAMSENIPGSFIKTNTKHLHHSF